MFIKKASVKIRINTDDKNENIPIETLYIHYLAKNILEIEKK